MMSADKAQSLTTSHFATQIANHIELIERNIRAVATSGGWKCMNTNGISGARPEVQEGVLKELADAGYSVKWSEDHSGLIVSWANA